MDQKYYYQVDEYGKKILCQLKSMTVDDFLSSVGKCATNFHRVVCGAQIQENGKMFQVLLCAETGEVVGRVEVTCTM